MSNLEVQIGGAAKYVVCCFSVSATSSLVVSLQRLVRARGSNRILLLVRAQSIESLVLPHNPNPMSRRAFGACCAQSHQGRIYIPQPRPPPRQYPPIAKAAHFQNSQNCKMHCITWATRRGQLPRSKWWRSAALCLNAAKRIVKKRSVKCTSYLPSASYY